MNILHKLPARLFYVFLCMCAVVIGWYFLKPDAALVDVGKAVSKEPKIQTPAPTQVPSIPASGETSAVVKSENAPYVVLPDDELGEIQGWVQSRGYFTRKDKEVYETYSDQVLADLGKQGDIKALEILADRMLQVKGDIKAAISYSNMGAVLGSTTALATLALFTAPSIYATKEEARPAILETIAVTQVIEMRGDPLLAEASKRGLVISRDADINLSAEEKIIVDNRAKEIYAKYQAIRTAKGLGDFDNSPPSLLGSFFDKK